MADSPRPAAREEHPILLGVRELRHGLGASVHDQFAATLFERASRVAATLRREDSRRQAPRGPTLDRLLSWRLPGPLFTLLLLAAPPAVMLAGSHQPARILSAWLLGLEEPLASALQGAGAPAWVVGFCVAGVYRATAWVLSLMLPSLLLLFPLLALVDGVGLSARLALHLDALMRQAGGHGWQGLALATGFGCNAAAVAACRRIESPRQRLLAMLTNTFMPCIGRWPTLLLASGILLGAAAPGPLWALATLPALAAVGVGICAALVCGRLMDGRVLPGALPTLQLELPPLRLPGLRGLLRDALRRRLVPTLSRALLLAAPAGGAIWLLGAAHRDGGSLLAALVAALDPAARLLGLDGVLLGASLLALPASELMLPAALMGYLAAGNLAGPAELAALPDLAPQLGWTWVTPICLMLLTVLRFPCGATTRAIWRETRSLPWTLLGNLLPAAVAALACLVVNRLLSLLLPS